MWVILACGVYGVMVLVGLFCIVGALLVCLDFRKWASRAIDAGQRRGLRGPAGVVFRGRYSHALIRILALGVGVVGIDALVLSGLSSLKGFTFLFVVFGWLYVGAGAMVRLRSGFREMIPPITVPLAAVIVV